MIRVGIIDSGFDEQWLASSASELGAWRDFTGANNPSDRLGHGSAITAAIGADGVNLFVARVFNDRLACPVSYIVDALEWLMESNVQVINMSFGMTRADERLKAVVDKILARDVALIAASPAQGAAVFPSAFDGVIRATSDARCGIHQLSFLNSPQADFGAFPGIPGAGPAGASIGCAHVTRTVCEILATNTFTEFAPTSERPLNERLYEALQARADWQGVEQRSMS